ncbi:MAG TPA: S9 family peptidase [Chthoniobacteraceae bacterium]|jgi:dipeptidyl aminopeptidase/acylaminoacyl peptidase|nr:S9 family peptidase [Chthoniobacteraceae bacterium]
MTEEPEDWPLIPRALLFAPPERGTPRLSPTGALLAYFVMAEGQRSLWIEPRERPEDARPLLRQIPPGVSSYFWAFDESCLLYLQDRDGNENWHLHAVDLAGGEVRDLTPFPGVSARLIRLSHRVPDKALVAMNLRDRALFDVYRVDLKTGELELLEHARGYASVIANADLAVRFVERMRADGGREILRLDSAGGTEPVLTIPLEDSALTGIEGFEESGEWIHLRDSRGRDTAAWTRLHLGSGKLEVLFEDPHADVGGLLRHPTKGTPQACTVCRERCRWIAMTGEMETVRQDLESVDSGDVAVVSRSLDDRQWLHASYRDDQPPRYYLYDRARRSSRFLFSSHSGLERLHFSAMHPVVLRARDGLEFGGYLRLPPWADRDRQGRPREPLPLVLTVHGGPWARETWGFNPSTQWLANRGYATLTVNFRGSTGYGKAFVNAGNREWGGKMLTDLIDAIDWAVAEGIADAGRLALMGSSYGGYAALMGAARLAGRVRCCVALSPPTDLVHFIESLPPHWSPERIMMMERMGDPATEEGRKLLREHSPATHPAGIQSPVLLLHGANDQRIRLVEADRFAQALQAHGVEIIYGVFPDEGHLFSRPRNVQAIAALSECFLARCLRGRCEGLGGALGKSSIEFRMGRELVRELADLQGPGAA